RRCQPQAQAVQDQRECHSQPGVSAPVTPATINTPTTSIARPSSTTPGGPSQAATYRAPAPETKAPSAIAASTQPAVITLNPKAFIKYSGSTNTIANSPTATAAAVKLPQVNVGSLNSVMSSRADRPTRGRCRS